MVEESPDLLFPFFCHKGVMGWCEKMAASCILHNFDQIELESKWVENLISICLTWLYNLRMIPSCHTLEFATCTWVVSNVKCWYGKTSGLQNIDLQMWNFLAIVHGKMLGWQKLVWQNFAVPSLSLKFHLECIHLYLNCKCLLINTDGCEKYCANHFFLHIVFDDIW